MSENMSINTPPVAETIFESDAELQAALKDLEQCICRYVDINDPGADPLYVTAQRWNGAGDSTENIRAWMAARGHNISVTTDALNPTTLTIEIYISGIHAPLHVGISDWITIDEGGGARISVWQDATFRQFFFPAHLRNAQPMPADLPTGPLNAEQMAHLEQWLDAKLAARDAEEETQVASVGINVTVAGDITDPEQIAERILASLGKSAPLPEGFADGGHVSRESLPDNRCARLCDGGILPGWRPRLFDQGDFLPDGQPDTAAPEGEDAVPVDEQLLSSFGEVVTESEFKSRIRRMLGIEREPCVSERQVGDRTIVEGTTADGYAYYAESRRVRPEPQEGPEEAPAACPCPHHADPAPERTPSDPIDTMRAVRDVYGDDYADRVMLHGLLERRGDIGAMRLLLDVAAEVDALRC